MNYPDYVVNEETTRAIQKALGIRREADANSYVTADEADAFYGESPGTLLMFGPQNMPWDKMILPDVIKDIPGCVLWWSADDMIINGE